MAHAPVEYARRDIARTSLLAGLSVATLGTLNVHAADLGATVSQAAEAPADNWARESEVVVVGLGAAGSAAAIEAKRAGADVLVVEASENGGGSTVMCGGFIYLGGGTPLQEQFGVQDDKEEMFKYLAAAAGPYANPDGIRVYCDKSLETYDFCINAGIKFGETLNPGHGKSRTPGVGLTYSGNELQVPFRDIAVPAPRGHSTGEDGGAAIFEPLKATVENENIEVLYSTKATDLVCDENGRVVGIIVEHDGLSERIRAKKAVVLAGGGFTANEDMVKDNTVYTNPYGRAIANPYEDGSCIKMGQKVGGDLFGMPMTQYSRAIYYIGSGDTDTCKAILVDKRGRRLISETSYGSFIGRAIMENGPDCYLVYDSSLKDIYDAMNCSPEYEGGTVEELAEAIGIDSACLQNTVDFYNSLCEAGEDRQFGKEPEFLTPLVTPPFYASYCGSSTCPFMTQGGLKIDTGSHVINVNGEVIPGLYAAGRCSDIIYGFYMGSGTSVADALTFGRIAGQNAAQEPSA